MFENKTITIFGGSGSIGSLIVEELVKYKPYAIRIFSNNEYELWLKQREWGSAPPYRYLLGDIKDFERVRRSLRRCDYAINCAAIKHVPFAEYNPLETVKTNIIGLENIIEACIETGIKKLLHISTDKAVEPTTVMGATKMIGERLCVVRDKQNPNLQVAAIRLGNIEGSRGSIFDFKNNFNFDNPFPITDPKMKRFIMPQSDVGIFILGLLKEMKGAEIFVPKLKEYNIIDYLNIKNYVVVGIRKNEKLQEKLITKSELKQAKEDDEKWIIS